LLFRYSALTFNAHAIHLDPEYCRTIEGHRNLLVHGPLTVTLLTTMLANQIREQHGDSAMITEITYRNVAPLYATEEMKLCGRDANGDGEYKLWVENPMGDIAVKASAKIKLS